MFSRLSRSHSKALPIALGTVAIAAATAFYLQTVTNIPLSSMNPIKYSRVMTNGSTCQYLK